MASKQELSDRVIQLEQLNKDLQEKLAELEPVEFIEQIFSINGKDFKVSRIERMKDLAEQWKHNFISDDDLLVLLKKA
jgi:hypothetical protein